MYKSIEDHGTATSVWLQALKRKAQEPTGELDDHVVLTTPYRELQEPTSRQEVSKKQLGPLRPTRTQD